MHNRTKASLFGLFTALSLVLTAWVPTAQSDPQTIDVTLLAINDKGSVVGQWLDGAAAEHGFAGNLPDNFVSFDYPGAISTALVGINNFRTICGTYTDSAGLNHGFLARLGN